MIRRHQRWEKSQRAQTAQPLDGRTPTSGGVWDLVRETQDHPLYDRYYGKLPSYLRGWLRTPRPDLTSLTADHKPHIVGVDCEMAQTTDDDSALTCISAIDSAGALIIDALVKPKHRLVDTREFITGLSITDFETVDTRLKGARAQLLRGLKRGAVLVGHSLYHDLNAMKLDYWPVIDTAFIYRYEGAVETCQPSLAFLSETITKVDFRKGGIHSGLEDAKATLDLVIHRLKHGPEELGPRAAKTATASTSKDLEKTLLVHRIPQGTTRAALFTLFGPGSGVHQVLGKFEVPPPPGGAKVKMTPRQKRKAREERERAAKVKKGEAPPPRKPERKVKRRTFAAQILFNKKEQCQAAFTALRGELGTDSTGRTQKDKVPFATLDGWVTVVVRKLDGAEKPDAATDGEESEEAKAATAEGGDGAGKRAQAEGGREAAGRPSKKAKARA